MSKYTREEIEAIKAKPDSEKTVKERQLSNLVSWKPGQSGNPKGRQKGSTNWSTHFKKLMGDPNFVRAMISNAPEQWKDIVEENSADIIAAGLIGSILRDVQSSVESGKQISKETREAIALLNKIAYGDKVVHEAEDSFFQKANITFTVVPDRENKPKDKE